MYRFSKAVSRRLMLEDPSVVSDETIYVWLDLADDTEKFARCDVYTGKVVMRPTFERLSDSR